MKALPYVIFMVVPVLGRMSDPDDDIRATATNTFASLVKMVPLEVRVTALQIDLDTHMFSRLVYQILPGFPRSYCNAATRNGSS